MSRRAVASDDKYLKENRPQAETYLGLPAKNYAYDCGCYVVDCPCGEMPPKCQAPWQIRYCCKHTEGFETLHHELETLH